MTDMSSGKCLTKKKVKFSDFDEEYDDDNFLSIYHLKLPTYGKQRR